MCCKCCGVTQRMLWVFGTGTLLLLLGIVTVLVWPEVSTKIVESSLVLKPGTPTYDNWMVTPIPIYTRFTLFHWTNPEEFRNPNVKPNFIEKGPYVYLQVTRKDDVDFHDNYTVSYYQDKIWIFQPDMSNGTLNELVTAPHVITATVADIMRDKNKYMKKVLNIILNKEGGMLYTTKTAGEWIFDGFDDRLIDFLNLFNSSAIHLPYTKFGWLVDRNGSKEYEGRFTMNTGVDDALKLGELTSWNGSPTNGFYPGECGRVNGSTGDLFHPRLDTTQDITIYTTDLCRFMNLAPGGKTSRHGIEGFEWLGTIDSLDSGENNPDQQCFCNPKEEVCPKTGVVDSRKCRNRAPIYVSFPHFFLADPSYVNAVTGLKPVEEKHRFRFAIEPTLGIPLEVHARIQMNVLLRPDDVFDIYKGVPTILMPVFFFEQIAELSEELADTARLGIHLKDDGLYFGYALIVVGAVIDLIGIVLTITKRWKSSSDDDDESLLSN